MQSMLNNSYSKNIEASVLKSIGFKISETDMEILTQIVRDQYDYLLKLTNYKSRTNADLVKLLLFEKQNGDESSPVFIDDEKFDKLSQESIFLRATVGPQYDADFFVNNPLYIANGDNGSGLYFCENDTKYLISHFKKFDTEKEQVGNIMKMVINPEASLIDRATLYKTQQNLMQAVKTGTYEDGSQIGFKGDKQALINLLDCDVSIIALLMGAKSVYVPLKHIYSKQPTSGDIIVLDASAVMLPKQIYRCNLRVDLTNLDSPSEKAKIDSFMNSDLTNLSIKANIDAKNINKKNNSKVQ